MIGGNNIVPIYEYECLNCGAKFEKIEIASKSFWKEDIKKSVYCGACNEKMAHRIFSKFKVGSKLLETTGKSGYETDALTLGKIIDEGGIPYEERARLRERDKMIERQNVYIKGLKERGKKYKFDPFSSEDEEDK